MPKHFLRGRSAGRTGFLAGAAVIAASQLVFIFMPTQPGASRRRQQQQWRHQVRAAAGSTCGDDADKSDFLILHRIPSAHIPGQGLPRL